MPSTPPGSWAKLKKASARLKKAFLPPRSWVILSQLGGVFLLFVLAVSLGLEDRFSPDGRKALLAGTAFFFGATVGVAEILLRYRDEPFRAASTTPAAAYAFLNGVISLGAFALLLRYPDQILPAVKGDLVLTAFAAGFGGMMVARSKLFNFQGEGGGEYSFGPAIVLDSFLRTLDRKVDRLRSAERHRRVFDKIHVLNLNQPADFNFALDYTQVTLQSYQNLSQAEKLAYAEEIEKYRGETGLPQNLRMLATGFALLNIAGEDNFDQVMADLERSLRPAVPQNSPQ